MTTTIEFIANVQAEVDNFSSKIKELETRKANIDSEISSVRIEIKRRNDLLLVWEGKADVVTKEEKKAARQPRSGSSVKTILEILENSGRPLNAQEILDGLVSRNAAGSAKNPILSIRSAIQLLKKRGQVASAGHGLFCLPGKGSVTGPAQ